MIWDNTTVIRYRVSKQTGKETYREKTPSVFENMENSQLHGVSSGVSEPEGAVSKQENPVQESLVPDVSEKRDASSSPFGFLRPTR